MTRRIDKPDTEADVELRNYLAQRPPVRFVMVAGAGSGKTTSLVKALDYLGRTHGSLLRRRAQKIACITYTEVAENEIWSDVGKDALYHVSTIHSFLWTVIKPFQSDIKLWILRSIQEKVDDCHRQIKSPKTRDQKKIKLLADIEDLERQRQDVIGINRFKYETGSNKYSAGLIGHAVVLKMVPDLILASELLAAIVARKFPFIFVDESQDTDPKVVAALTAIASTQVDEFSLGFFGDTMQKIYNNPHRG
jgi:DNA helicase II / ATP-dependent DNA helicase PcrA